MVVWCFPRAAHHIRLTPQPRFFCNARPWVNCTAKRYHCTKIPDVDLCPEAYASGAFPPGCTAKDFVLIEQGKEVWCKCNDLDCNKQVASLYCTIASKTLQCESIANIEQYPPKVGIHSMFLC